MAESNYMPILGHVKDRIHNQLIAFPELSVIHQLLREMNLHGYMIGGTIRDFMLPRSIKDIDLAINANPDNFLRILSKKVKGNTICLDREYLIFRFITKDKKIFDLSPLKGDNIFQDLSKRDFTINAMALDLDELFSQPHHLHLIDPLGGMKDITLKKIRAICDEVFMDDSIRIMRAYRLAGQLNYKIEPHTKFLIERDKELLKKAASERIREELFLLLSLDHSSPCVNLLYQHGLFPILFSQRLPSHFMTEKVEALWPRALQVLGFLEETLTNESLEDHTCRQDLNYSLSQIAGHQTSYKPLLKLSALLSVIPESIAEKKEPGFSFSKKVSKNHLDPIDFLLRALCLTTPQRRYILTCLQAYQEPVQLIKNNCCTPKYFYRFFRDYGEAGLGALILTLASQKASLGHNYTTGFLYPLFSRMVVFYFDWQAKNKEPLLDGDLLMSYFHLSPGPIIGELIDLVKEAMAEGKINSKDEALDLVKKFLKS